MTGSLDDLFIYFRKLNDPPPEHDNTVPLETRCEIIFIHCIIVINSAKTSVFSFTTLRTFSSGKPLKSYIIGYLTNVK